MLNPAAVQYVWSRQLQALCDQLPANRQRSSLVHGLHRAVGLLDHPSVDILEPDLSLGSPQQLARYHTEQYIDFVLGLDDGYNEDDGLKEKYGLLHDCPVFPALAHYIQYVAAATCTACRALIDGATVSICWDGGRHHAQRDRASGFCYIADIVLGIMLLAKEGRPRINNKPRRNKRPRIMYIDLDLHHGDGVAKAFHSPTHFVTGKERPPQVLTLSVHHSSRTFFPGPTPIPAPDTTSPFTLSVPLAPYPSTSTYQRVFEACIAPVREAFDPDYIVLQLGADGLPGDPIGQWGAWNAGGVGGMAWCAKQVQGWGLPVCVLGGGGYNHANTARAWTAVDHDLPQEIPHHDHFEAYGPSFQMDVESSNIADQNTGADLADMAISFQMISRRIAALVA